ncbi:MAG: excinuclease ABC subunit UvrB, partial [bacterium]|nr:excinuclease ABC subunit UvrB [bacterium]
EFKDFFPNNGAHYFVSYYDYYQPEAYIPQTDTYIEKDAKINQQIDRLRHAAVQDVILRKDVIIAASVSCIYNIGSPANYEFVSSEFKMDQKITRRNFLAALTALQYQRNDVEFSPGTFRIRGNLVEINLITGEGAIRVEFLGDKIESIQKSTSSINLIYGVGVKNFKIFPATFWVTPQEKIKTAVKGIRQELDSRLKELRKQNKIVEAQRLEKRTEYDIEMIEESGYCNGIENYSSHMEFRKQGDPPFSLVDYFRYYHPEGFLIFIDESHQTIPQLKAMSVQDRIRKQTLIEHGFRLPSAIDNRPLAFKEFEERIDRAIYVSATPSEHEKNKSKKENITELLIRPTGLLEPEIEIRPTENQLNDLVVEIKKRIEKGQKTLVLSLTKRLAEAISDYLSEKGIKNKWLHSEVKTLERPEILRKLRLGEYDALVGINLLREGLDLPEVSLVAILDADKEGFLRNETTLIQIMGRAARHIEGKIILYADKTTGSMNSAIKEIERRRKIQNDYNQKHHIIPQPIKKEVRDWIFAQKEKIIASEFGEAQDRKMLEKEMKEAAKNLDFERAAVIRDLIKKLSK